MPYGHARRKRVNLEELLCTAVQKTFPAMKLLPKNLLTLPILAQANSFCCPEKNDDAY